MKTINALGIDSNLGYPRGHSHRAVQTLMQEPFRAALARADIRLNWQTLDADPTTRAESSHQLTGEEQLAQINHQVAARVEALVRSQQPLLVLGGDHSVAMGTWSGAIAAGGRHDTDGAQSFGLLWIDAHLDAHNFCSSASGNIHGMPLRALLDDSDARLARLCPQSGKLRGKNLQLLGIRSFEPREMKFLEEQGASITTMQQLPRGDCCAAVLQALHTLSKRCTHIGISLDIDAIDPLQAPGVATPEPAGIALQSLCKALTQARRFDKVVALEICEFDPSADTRQRTQNTLLRLIVSFYG